jgi:hypothetical protein
MMKFLLKGKRVLMVLAMCLLACGLAQTVQTAEAAERSGTITLRYVVADADFEIYKVTEENGSGELVRTEAFEGYKVDLTQKEAAATLGSYVRRDKVEPMKTGSTDEDGNLTFSALTKGSYLILGQAVTVKGVTYTPSPVLISIPQTVDSGVKWYVSSELKYEETSVSQGGSPSSPLLTSVSAKKVWKDDDEATRPESVSVQLLCDGAVYETVTLSAGNNWSHQWSSLDGSKSWSVVEETVPSGYVVSVGNSGNAYTITNTADTSLGDEDTDIVETGKTPNDKTNKPGTTPNDKTTTSGTTPDDETTIGTTTTDKVSTPMTSEGLPRTGQLWWPVTALAGAGLLLLMAGLVCRKKAQAEDK